MNMDDEFLGSDPFVSSNKDRIEHETGKLIREGRAIVVGSYLSKQGGDDKKDQSDFQKAISDLPYRSKSKFMRLLKALSGFRWYSRTYLEDKSKIASDSALRHQIIRGKKVLSKIGYMIISERKKPYRYRVIKIAAQK